MLFRRLGPVLAVVLLTLACMSAPPLRDQDDTRAAAARREMVATQIRARGVTDRRVLAALERVPRHRFVRHGDEASAHRDTPLPISEGQTISQPYIVAYMSEALALAPDARVLEVGTGSGYQAAVLGELVREVYTVEIIPSLAEAATRTLADLGYANVQVKAGDGYEGWPEHAPFDAIIVTAAPDHVPPPLVEQLKPGGRLVIPVGVEVQDLLVLTRTAEGLREETRLPVRFVPLTRRGQP